MTNHQKGRGNAVYFSSRFAQNIYKEEIKMEARVLVQQKGIVVPFKKEIDLTFVNIANRKAELREREKAAKEYSAGCKRNIIDKEDVMCFLSGLSVCTLIGALYFLGCIF